LQPFYGFLKEKRRFWHIDYLLADKNLSVEVVIAAETNKKMECNINSYMKRIKGSKIQVKGFGASDCKKNAEVTCCIFQRLRM